MDKEQKVSNIKPRLCYSQDISRKPTFILLQVEPDLKHSFKHKDHGRLGYHAT